MSCLHTGFASTFTYKRMDVQLIFSRSTYEQGFTHNSHKTIQNRCLFWCRSRSIRSSPYLIQNVTKLIRIYLRRNAEYDSSETGTETKETITETIQNREGRRGGKSERQIGGIKKKNYFRGMVHIKCKYSSLPNLLKLICNVSNMLHWYSMFRWLSITTNTPTHLASLPQIVHYQMVISQWRIQNSPRVGHLPIV